MDEKMKKWTLKNAYIPLGLLAAFVLWTIAVRYLDVQPIGPDGSSVGFATLNGWVHQRTGVHMTLYTITDWLGLVPVCVALGFALLGLYELIQRRSFLKVDSSLFVLGGLYVLVIAFYFFFESYVINYRPVLIDGYLEASYPSSTTLLVLCVMPTAMMQLHTRIRSKAMKALVLGVLGAFTACMVIGRLLSGVHWFTDIVGGALLSAGLVTLYHGVNMRLLPKA